MPRKSSRSTVDRLAEAPAVGAVKPTPVSQQLVRSPQGRTTLLDGRTDGGADWPPAPVPTQVPTGDTPAAEIAPETAAAWAAAEAAIADVQDQEPTTEIADQVEDEPTAARPAAVVVGGLLS